MQKRNLTDSQICGGYSKGSLMGNWYEERMNVSRDNPVQKIVRKVEPNFSFEHGSTVHDLDRITRLRKPNHNIITNGERTVIRDRKQIEYKSEMKDRIAPAASSIARVQDHRSIVKFAGQRTLFNVYTPEAVQINYHNRAKLFNDANCSQIMEQKEKKHQDKDQTTYVSTYAGSYDGKNFINTEHPLQRSQKVEPRNDIMNSLPLAQGQWALKPNIHMDGYYRHIRSNVTDSPNKFLTNR